MSVSLTVVLSIIARSVTDIGISTTQDDAVRAFNAAEAGIEKAIIGSELSGSFEDGSGASFTTTITETGGGTSSFLYPVELNAGESATFWLVSHTIDPTTQEEKITCGGDPANLCERQPFIRICWGDNSPYANLTTIPAIVFEVYYNSDTVSYLKWDTLGDYSDIQVAIATSDPNSSRRSINQFQANSNAQPCGTVGGKTFAFWRRFFLNPGGTFEDISIPDWTLMSNGSIIMVKVHMLYNTDKAHPIAIILGGGKLPAQGKIIESTGVSSDNYRKLSVFQGYPELPFAFNSAVFSSGDISK
jgi:hypothetical protein